MLICTNLTSVVCRYLKWNTYLWRLDMNSNVVTTLFALTVRWCAEAPESGRRLPGRKELNVTRWTFYSRKTSHADFFSSVWFPASLFPLSVHRWCNISALFPHRPHKRLNKASFSSVSTTGSDFFNLTINDPPPPPPLSEWIYLHNLLWIIFNLCRNCFPLVRLNVSKGG